MEFESRWESGMTDHCWYAVNTSQVVAEQGLRVPNLFCVTWSSFYVGRPVRS